LDITFLAFRLPAIARRSGEAGGDESQEIAVAFGEYMKKIMVILLILSG
jgi:hypothetical protein